MGGGRSGLFPGTQGSDNFQLTLFPAAISVHRESLSYSFDQDINVGANFSCIGENSPNHRSYCYLLTPSDILEKCLHWRIGAITSGKLVSWIKSKMTDTNCCMVPSQLRDLLKEYLVLLQSAKAAGKSYNKDVFLRYVEQLEKKLENMLQ